MSDNRKTFEQAANTNMAKALFAIRGFNSASIEDVAEMTKTSSDFVRATEAGYVEPTEEYIALLEAGLDSKPVTVEKLVSLFENPTSIKEKFLVGLINKAKAINDSDGGILCELECRIRNYFGGKKSVEKALPSTVVSQYDLA